jgi:NarL family two-component system response regulator LiaR
MTNSLRVLVVDDHAIVRRGIRALLATEPDIDMVGEAENGKEAISHEVDGIEAIRRITARRPEARILVLTSFATNEKVFPAIKAGALGYLLKDSEPEVLVQAIRQAHRGESSIHPTIARKLLEELSPLVERPATPKQLLERELAVLQRVAQGQSNQEIADRLVMNEAEVHTHISNILSKLHLVSRTQAVLYALQEGLASLDDTAPDSLSRLLGAFREVGDSVSSASGEGAPQEVTQPHLPEEPLSERELRVLRLIAEHQTVAQELALAGEIQASFLPDALPDVAGWQLAATLEPARETSGDFYDFIPLPNGRFGLVIADVVDKGMGAALYMALCRTLIRTYAVEHDTQPELVFGAANRRILLDTHSKLFVTLFYGVLEPSTGLLTYCNAGHNPPYLLRDQNKGPVQALRRTGMPLGIFEDVSWEQNSVQLAPGDVLVLYTDGIPEAQDRQEAFFGEKRLQEIVQSNLGRSAQEIQDALLAEVRRFRGDASQNDDITLMVVVREL